MNDDKTNDDVPDSSKRIGTLITEALTESKPPKRKPRSGTYVRTGLTLADPPKTETNNSQVA